jgi:hypothetical protein
VGRHIAGIVRIMMDLVFDSLAVLTCTGCGGELAVALDLVDWSSKEFSAPCPTCGTPRDQATPSREFKYNIRQE